MKRHNRNAGQVLDCFFSRAVKPSREQIEASRQNVAQRLMAWPPARVEESFEAAVERRKPFARVTAIPVATAVMVAAVIGLTILVRDFAPPDIRHVMAEAVAGTLYRISGGAAQSIQSGEQIESGAVIRSESDQGAVFALLDGSRIEMRSRSEVALERVDDGVRIRLVAGSVIVNAAKQRTGHLYVQTKDVTVSVVGTVFLVEAAEAGSRVAVIQGEVHVQQGTTSKTLLPGEQVTTAPSIQHVPLAEELSWSRNVAEHRALLQQAIAAIAVTATIPPQNRQPRVTFESVSVRGRTSVGAIGGGGRRGGGDPAVNVFGRGAPGVCNGRVQLDSKHLIFTNATVYNLISVAYGIDCRDASLGNLISGGPAWVTSDRFDIDATIPDGSPTFTTQQLNRHNAPVLQTMLQTFLAERFRLSVHRDTKDTPLYNLIVVADGKLKPAEDQSENYRPSDVRQQVLRLGSEFLEKGMIIAGGHLGMIVEDSGAAVIRAEAIQIPLIFTVLYTQIKDRMIVDKTNLSGQFDFTVRFAAAYRLEGLQAGTPFVPPPPGPTLFEALQDQIGLKLEPATVPLQAIVIDRVERPAEN
jgi:uncharacterized protein (TIGR03435 family)